MRKPNVGTALCVVVLSLGGCFDSSNVSDPSAAVSGLPRVDVLVAEADGRPAYLSGDLGVRLGGVLSVFGVDGEALLETRAHREPNGQTHRRFQQTRYGLPVVGGDVRIHEMDGTIYAISAPAWDGNELVHPRINAVRARSQALALSPGASEAGVADLVYVVPSSGDAPRLAWRSQVRGKKTTGLPIDDAVFIDAEFGTLVDRHPRIMTARNRSTYDSEGKTVVFGPVTGKLKLVESQTSIGDAAVDAAHANAGVTYDCYKALFNRDSIDNAGAALKSYAHYGKKYNNAFWNGSQMVYGDGDGTLMTSLSLSLDVVSHELTHAVTENTSGLVYSNQPGALNEAWSDIMGATCEIWKAGALLPSAWVLGEAAWTPATPDDGLRYMNDPTKDDYSKDWYPERLTGTADNGGVHGNSGIANLAFVLAVQGGVHPRGKSTIQVPAIGWEKTAQIFYRAGAMYLTSNSSFATARAKTAQAAADLYGPAEVYAIDAAWFAVGVGTTAPIPPGDDGGGDDGDGGDTGGGAPIHETALAGALGSEARWQVKVPAGATGLKVSIAGGTGDADLYMKLGAAPTQSVWDYRPYLSTNNETVNVPAAKTGGDWHIMVRGYKAYSGVSLDVTWN